ncbi:tetratricopeptide repeat protein [Paraburkholderia sp. Ac-20340]|uniref:tetratricopeptide repeat protein n=1 Tax=Paraburkholderia sp. Ac-20340 TaxID=2703888 RepID=UPI0019823900|nr:tetratricopeptide repeat protein [Paraburkholderia sp. Ac-20340]MBN3852651.1 tetratricopeptide repeat protein [Paraburkholderia sp. Ac-20340]
MEAFEHAFEQALQAHEAGRLDEARDGYLRVLESQPDHAQAWHLLGLIEYAQGANGKAIALIRKAIAISDTPLFQDNLGSVLSSENDLAAAEAAWLQAIELDSSFTSSYYKLGTLWMGQGYVEAAEAALRRAIELDPRHVDAHLNLGILMGERGWFDEAQVSLRHALAIEPANARLHQNLGWLLVKAQRYREAEACYRRAIELLPGSAMLYSGLASTLTGQARFDEAESACAHGLALDPQCADLHVNHGTMLLRAERRDEAEAALRRALELDPGNLRAQFNLSHIELKDGRYEEGWRGFETRTAVFKETAHLPPLTSQWPQWQGEPLRGKSLLVLCEQGLGDSLQFIRYLPMLKAYGPARLTVLCQPPLKRLFDGIEGIDVRAQSDAIDAIPRHDFWCLMMSLPLRFGTTLATIPAAVPYLRAPAPLIAQWQARLPSSGFKVGLVWAGDSRPHLPDLQATDARRSLHARAFEPLLDTPGVSFVSLQFGAATRAQLDEIDAHWRPVDPMGGVTDFADTAAIVACLDLVITVDTSMAHLAGALNRPVWILSRFDGCWRWLADRDDSPWYPSARLFRQRRPAEWGEVIERVRQALQLRAQEAAHP